MGNLKILTLSRLRACLWPDKRIYICTLAEEIAFAFFCCCCRMTNLDKAFEAVDSNDLPQLAYLFQLHKDLDVNGHLPFYETDTLLSVALDQNYCDMVAFLLLRGANPMDLATRVRGRITNDSILIETMLLPTIDVNKPLGSYLFHPEMHALTAETMLFDTSQTISRPLRNCLRNIVESKTPLIYAIEHRKDYVVEYLVQRRGADPNLGMDRAWTMFNTPLALAASYVEHGPLRKNPNVQTLLAFGADPLHSGRLSQELRQEHWRMSQSNKQ